MNTNYWHKIAEALIRAGVGESASVTLVACEGQPATVTVVEGGGIRVLVEFKSEKADETLFREKYNELL